MKPVLVNGDLWIPKIVPPGHPSLIDRTGNPRAATADGRNHIISVSSAIVPPLLDKVILHEVTHAITMSHGLLPLLRASVPEELWILVEEWSAELVERYAVEAIALASEMLGRPVCIDGYCIIPS